ncbi:MAG: hypothetical protein PVSMB8_08160 [Vulcanimicrobiaceae bacterium]
MNDRTARTTEAPDAPEAERTLHAREVLVDENDADDDAFVDELEHSTMGGSERLGGTP